MLELLLALGLIALFASVLIGGSSRLLSDTPASADEVFWKACAAARKAALQSGREVRLAWADDRDGGRRFIVNENGATKIFSVVSSNPNLVVSFLAAQKSAGNAVIMAGQVVELDSLRFATFYPDGTCTPFRLQIRHGVDSHILTIDPWTCAQVLTPPDPFAR